MKPFKTLLAAGLLTAAALAGTAYAEGGPCPAGPADGKASNCKFDPAKMEARIAEHQKALHDKLKIQPNQEAAWKTFNDAMKPQGMPMERPKMDGNATTPERMQAHVDMMQKHLDAMKQRADATKTFYAQLTPEQKKTFDQEGNRMQQRMREHMMRKPMASQPK